MTVIDADKQFNTFSRFFTILNTLKEDLKFHQISRVEINVVKSTKTKNEKKIIISKVKAETLKEDLKTYVQVFEDTSVKITASKKLYVSIASRSTTKAVARAENLKKMSKKLSLFEDYKFSVVENKQNRETRRITRIQLASDMKSLNMSFIEATSFNT